MHKLSTVKSQGWDTQLDSALCPTREGEGATHAFKPLLAHICDFITVELENGIQLVFCPAWAVLLKWVGEYVLDRLTTSAKNLLRMSN